VTSETFKHFRAEFHRIADIDSCRCPCRTFTSGDNADGNRRAEEWARLDGSKITSDAKLLDFDLSPAEYGELVERYKENGTMSRLLFAYGEKRNQARAEKHPGEATSPFDEGYFDTSTVPTKESKSREYAGDAIKAKSLADLMTLDRGYMRGIDSEMVNAEYSAFMGE
jgi:hypothetical protein